MKQILILICFFGLFLCSPILDIKVVQDHERLDVDLLVDSSNLRHVECYLQCTDESSKNYEFTITLFQNEIYENVWSGSTFVPASTCVLSETRITDSIGDISTHAHPVEVISSPEKR
jgi:hypothetical protein